MTQSDMKLMKRLLFARKDYDPQFTRVQMPTA